MERSYKCFVINAPSWASFIWSSIRPMLSERNRGKISGSSGVPEALRTALGGEAAVQQMLASVPAKLPAKSAAHTSEPAAKPPREAPPSICAQS